MAWRRRCASRSRAKVESPRMLIRSIGSIWTATLRLIRFPRQPSGNANGTLTYFAAPCPGAQPPGTGITVPQLSIASKLYAIFALLATVTVGLAGIAVVNALHHVELTGEFEAAQAGAHNVDRANGLIYAVMMEARGIYLADDAKTAQPYADSLL